MSSANSPLGVPIPNHMSALPRPQQPVHRGTVNDIQALDVIRNFRQELELYRPASNRIYNVSFERFVQDCPTLNFVDELIWFATNGARNIHTVTVLEATMPVASAMQLNAC